jgi:hypothetical protein
MRQVAVQCEQSSDRQIECTAFCSHRHMAGDSLDRDPAFGLVPRKSRACLQGDEDDAKIVILDEGLGVLAAVPVGFAVKLAPVPWLDRIRERKLPVAAYAASCAGCRRAGRVTSWTSRSSRAEARTAGFC